MLETIKEFVNKIIDTLFTAELAAYYLLGFVGLFALLYLIAFIVSFCGRLTKVKRAQKMLMENFTPACMEEALDKMPDELRFAYISSRDRRVNPLAVFTFESCVRTPYTLSFASRFVKFTVVLAAILSFTAFAFFGLAFAKTGITAYSIYSWYALFGIAVMTLFGTAVAAIISSSRHKRAVKRYERFHEMAVLADIAEFISFGASTTIERTIPKGNVDEFVEGVTIMCNEGSYTVTSLKEAAYQLQQMRGKSENSTPEIQRKLNETTNLIIKTMAIAMRNEQAAG